MHMIGWQFVHFCWRTIYHIVKVHDESLHRKQPSYQTASSDDTGLGREGDYSHHTVNWYHWIGSLLSISVEFTFVCMCCFLILPLTRFLQHCDGDDSPSPTNWHTLNERVTDSLVSSRLSDNILDPFDFGRALLRYAHSARQVIVSVQEIACLLLYYGCPLVWTTTL